jgi:membrane-bound metal-dependent hydrolase YbcI (DUF457 family)
VFFWFAGMSVVLVWAVFTSPIVDYRLVALGSVLPVVDVAFGGPRVLHSVVGSVALMGVVMAATVGRRLLRRRLLGLPIGTFMHLVLDGVWADTHAFWWPFAGTAWSTSKVPEASRPGFGIVLELVGVGALWWCYRRFRLGEPERRALFLRTGHIGRDVSR